MNRLSWSLAQRTEEDGERPQWRPLLFRFWAQLGWAGTLCAISVVVSLRHDSVRHPYFFNHDTHESCWADSTDYAEAKEWGGFTVTTVLVFFAFMLQPRAEFGSHTHHTALAPSIADPWSLLQANQTNPATEPMCHATCTNTCMHTHTHTPMHAHTRGSRARALMLHMAATRSSCPSATWTGGCHLKLVSKLVPQLATSSYCSDVAAAKSDSSRLLPKSRPSFHLKGCCSPSTAAYLPHPNAAACNCCWTNCKDRNEGMAA